MVDLAGLVISVSPTSTIRKRDGVEIVRCTIGLHDMSGYSIYITLWGEHCQIEGVKLANLRGLPTPPAVAICCYDRVCLSLLFGFFIASEDLFMA